MMIFYTDRVRIAQEYKVWANENNIKDCAESVIAFLQVKGYLNEDKIWEEKERTR